MTKLTKSAALALVVALFALPASAATITGSLTYSGNWTLDDGVALGSATSLAFPANDFDVDGATGDFDGAGISAGDFGSIADFDFALSGGPAALLEIAGLTFTLETVSVTAQTDAFLLLEGTGVITGANIMDTQATFFLSANVAGPLNVFSSGITAVPVPGAVWLFASALMALGIRRRA
ncbi:MAG: hypothetical protein AB8G17_10105 [Gammaproteobacteria bacterium]